METKRQGPDFRRIHGKIKIVAVIIAAILIMSVIGFVALYIDATTPSYYGPGPIEVTIQPDKSYFILGENVTFTITVINNQSWPVTYPLSEKISILKDGTETEGSGIQIDYPPKIPTYPANTNTSFSWSWTELKNANQTILRQPGNYSISFYMKGLEYSALAYCTFEIRKE